jgi:hypothetical protein
MCKFLLVAGVALIFFGIAAFVHDAVSQGDYATTVGDVLTTVGVPFRYQRVIYNSSEIARALMVVPFAYGAILVGIIASIGSAVCNRAGRHAEV